MAEKYISADTAINAVFDAIADGRSIYIALKTIPAADVVEVRHGWWEKKQHAINWSCSLCGNEPFHCHLEHMNFCPNCGADMREES